MTPRQPHFRKAEPRVNGCRPADSVVTSVVLHTLQGALLESVLFPGNSSWLCEPPPVVPTTDCRLPLLSHHGPSGNGWPGAVEAAPEAGVGGLGVPGSGPRPQPARSAVLPRLSAMLIFGLGRPCPGISRHASRRPVCRPEPGGRRDRTAVAPLPRSARWTLPRPIALCLGLCLAAVAATTPRAVAAAFASGCVAEDTTAMSAFNLLHLVTKSQPVALRACGLPSGSSRDKKNCKVAFSQQELRKRLTPLQYHVTQEKGTESAFEGEYTHHKDPGIYKCVVCGTPLFKMKGVRDEKQNRLTRNVLRKVVGRLMPRYENLIHGLLTNQTSLQETFNMNPLPSDTAECLCGREDGVSGKMELPVVLYEISLPRHR
ncbi:methionine-R-sulfoxide reductase B3 [Rattus rattus]|uniref:methionine-R-sulfoxide reductase B3 n=1 Tax=Rattus rattus TaxID=10117 RepID=UPI0013F30EBB|nr:methionine-R-sulfoxide reductase B3 [Rattus rattus]